MDHEPDKAEFWSLNDRVAVEPIVVNKVTTVSENGGFATITQKRQTTTSRVVMDFILPDSKHGSFPTIIGPDDWFVILRGDAGHKPWAKEIYTMEDGLSFILVPISEILGFKRG